jgi:hypothetical protein
VLKRVDDPAELAALAPLAASDEGLVDFIDAHYREPGDRLFRLERLPVYADNEATLARWRSGETEPDWSATLAAERERGLVQERVRVLSVGLTDDERASCLLAHPTNGRFERILVLHEGEHEVPDLGTDDFWLIRPAAGGAHVAVMHYDGAGAFLGDEIVDGQDRGTAFVTVADRALAAAEPFSRWAARHTGEIPSRKAA